MTFTMKYARPDNTFFTTFKGVKAELFKEICFEHPIHVYCYDVDSIKMKSVDGISVKSIDGNFAVIELLCYSGSNANGGKIKKTVVARSKYPITVYRGCLAVKIHGENCYIGKLRRD